MRWVFIFILTLVLASSVIGYFPEPPYQFQIQWKKMEGDKVVEAEWIDLKVVYQLAKGNPGSWGYSADLGLQRKKIYIDWDHYIATTFEIPELPYDISGYKYKLNNILSNRYRIQWKTIDELTWRRPTNWTSIVVFPDKD